MKTTQELLKKSANLQVSIPPRQKLNLSRFIEARQMPRSIELMGFQIIVSNVFILKDYLFMGLYNSYRTRKAEGLCKPIWNRESPLNSYLKEVEKEKPNPRELHKVFFLKPQPSLTEERVLAAFLVRLRVLYPSKVSCTNIEDLIGVSM